MAGFLFSYHHECLLCSPLFSIYGVGRNCENNWRLRISNVFEYFFFLLIVEWVNYYGTDFEKRSIPLTCLDWVDQVRCVFTGFQKCVFTIVWISLNFQVLLIISSLPTDVANSPTRNDDGEFADGVPSNSEEDALMRAVQMAKPCFELARSANLDAELFKVLTSSSFSKYVWLYSTGQRVRVGW